MVVMDAQLYEYIKTIEFYTLNKQVVWYVNYVSIIMESRVVLGTENRMLNRT